MKTNDQAQQSAAAQEQGNVAPEQQEAYDIFVGQGTRLAQGAAKGLQGQANPQAIGDAMAGIVERVEAEGAKNGIQFDLAVMLHGAGNILQNLLVLAGVELDEAQTKEAVGHMVGRYLENAVQSGRMTQEQVVQLGQQAEQQGGDGVLGAAPAGPVTPMR